MLIKAQSRSQRSHIIGKGLDKRERERESDSKGFGVIHSLGSNESSAISSLHGFGMLPPFDLQPSPLLQSNVNT